MIIYLLAITTLIFPFQPPQAPVLEVLEPSRYIIQELDKNGIDSDFGLLVARCESSLNLKATHINKNGSNDAGIWQINSIHKLSDECRFDLKCSTDWVIEKVKRDKGWSAWACARKVKNPSK